jgi:hypothetical protein
MKPQHNNNENNTMIVNRRRLIAGLATFAPIVPAVAAASKIDPQADQRRPLPR